MMIKVLIIDDEPLVRMGMKTIIDWEKYGYNIVGEAGNGVSGLEKIFEYKPDLVLIDIMMPQMDGLTCITEARKGGFAGKFIILSCVSEIEYLQKAIQVGVSRYVLKSSVKPSEILETVEEVAGEIKRAENEEESFQKNTNQFAFQEFLNLILKNVVTERADIAEKMKVFGFDEKQSVYMLVSSVRENGRDFRKLLYRMASVGESLLDENWGICFLNFEDYLVLFMEAVSRAEAEDVEFRLKASAKQYFDVGLLTQIRRINIQEWDIAQQYEDAKKELLRSFYDKKGEGKGDGSELIPLTEFASFEKLSSALEMIRNLLLQRHALTEAEAKKIYVDAVEYVILLFELDRGTDTARDLWRLNSFEQVHTQTLHILKKCYELAEEKGYTEYEDELTDTMIKYIHSHCNSRISTRDVAEHVHFSVDYTCKYFKKKTGTNLTDYILKLKIFRSHKELLEGRSIAEVADIYGFSSGGHYLKVFKKYEGITPGAFVKKDRNSI